MPDNGGRAFSAAYPSLALEDFEGSSATPGTIKYRTPQAALSAGNGAGC
ncbi:hypothetical protein G5V58_08435 [Nocardioides anomalus]|uniref:Uncharacterized protein n=1 Tax=Nocardioides anomalus TaxID=2712223 RepID=A0A6G6WBU1_9ACTN|nr:hypothetical protein [Nocardioides anomalus]QIG42798.1 hypothetical protein G5V58_08435 [Nocardioides anomalus]